MGCVVGLEGLVPFFHFSCSPFLVLVAPHRIRKFRFVILLRRRDLKSTVERATNTFNLFRNVAAKLQFQTKVFGTVVQLNSSPF